MNTNSIIRFAKKEDIHDIVDLCKAHALYEQSDYTKEGKAEQLVEDLFGNDPKLYCLVVENDKKLIGYATYMEQYATWDARSYIYMDCLFLNEDARGYGLGEQLVNKIKEEGVKLGCDLIQWQTPDFNTRAIKFYHRIGANAKNKERFFLKI